MTFPEYLKKIEACDDAVKWITENNLTPQQAWDTCHRGDWLLWWAEKEKVDRRKLVLCAGLCAQTVEHLMTDQRSKDGVKAAIDYGYGLIDYEQLKAFARAASAAWNAAWDAAWDAEWATARDAARAASDAAKDAAMAASDTAMAAAMAARDTVWEHHNQLYGKKQKLIDANQKQTADIVRSIITPTWIETILN